MKPALSILQLDTQFPRVPGDVACPDTYAIPVEIISIPAASVGRIVTTEPAGIDIRPFEEAVQTARGDIIATSCGFLAHWQDHLQSLTDRPVIASALGALRDRQFDPLKTVIVTFDAQKLRIGHKEALGDFAVGLVGLDPTSHLRQVIENNERSLDTTKAQKEICDLLAPHILSRTRTLVLECTNLPPYKAAMKSTFGVQIVDILTEIEKCREGTVRRAFC